MTLVCPSQPFFYQFRGDDGITLQGHQFWNVTYTTSTSRRLSLVDETEQAYMHRHLAGSTASTAKCSQSLLKSCLGIVTSSDVDVFANPPKDFGELMKLIPFTTCFKRTSSVSLASSFLSNLLLVCSLTCYMPFSCNLSPHAHATPLLSRIVSRTQPIKPCSTKLLRVKPRLPLWWLSTSRPVCQPGRKLLIQFCTVTEMDVLTVTLVTQSPRCQSPSLLVPLLPMQQTSM